MTDKGIELITSHEGLRLAPYICPGGKATIGYGNTRYPDGTPVAITDPEITKEQAVAMLKITLSKFEAKVRAMFGDMPQHKIDALTSLAYNIGIGRLGKSTLAGKIKAGAPDNEIADAFMLFTMATVNGKKKQLPGLVKRRKAEVSLYFAGEK